MSTKTKATIGQRLYSNIIDLLFIVGSSSALGGLHTVYMYITTGESSLQTSLFIFSLGSYYLFPAILAVSEIIFGKSPGKWFMGLHIGICDTTHSPYWARFLRCLIKYGCLIIFYLWVISFVANSMYPNDIRFQKHVRILLGTFYRLLFYPYLVFTIISFLFSLRSSRLALHDQITGTAVHETGGGKQLKELEKYLHWLN